ncbi:MAG TPA: LysR family transcriptional regulator [Acidimicrobiales bacterium]|nr:LysR family transcriptional regulator [Acidimicrobiales bacterium]
MSRPEQLRTFVAVYRARSVTEGARERGVSQPAASQQLAGLERAVGGPLFVRTPRGVEPTGRAVELYAETAPALDQLEAVLARLDEGRPPGAAAPLRLGSTAEVFSALILPRMGATDLAVVTRFGDDGELLGLLERGELDVAVTSAVPTRRTVTAVPMGQKRFVLVASPAVVAGASFGSLSELADWLVGQSWAAYSLELPITRRFWQTHLGRPFSARLRLVAPDLRAVSGAVEQGMGCSILPRFVCARALDERRIVEVHPVSDLIPDEPWFACARSADTGRAAVAEFVHLFDRPERPDSRESTGSDG